MQGWRRVVGYTADREKELTAESFFQDRYHDTADAVTKFHAGAAQGKRSRVVVCDVAHVTCRSVGAFLRYAAKDPEIGWYRGNYFVPESF